MGFRSRAKKEAKAAAASSTAPEGSAAGAEPSEGPRALSREAMVPSAMQHQVSSGALPASAPAVERLRQATPPSSDRPRRRAALPPVGGAVAALAALLAVAAMAFEALDYRYGVVLLPLAAVVLALSALLPMAPRREVHPESAKLRLVGLALGALALLLVLATVEGLAAFAATRLLFSFSQLAVLLVRAYPLAACAFVLAGALMRLGAGRWGHVLEVPPQRRTLATLLAVAALVPTGVVLLAVLPQGEGLVTLTVDRAPFVGALAVVAALGALWSAALPSFAQMGDWLAREGLRRSRLAKNLALGLGGGALAAALAGLAAAYVIGLHAAVPLLALASLLALGAGFPAGVARFVPPMSVEDPALALARRTSALRGLLAGAAVAFLVALLGLAALASDYEALVGAVALGLAVAVQAGLALASPRVPVPATLPEGRRSAAYVLSLVALLLAFFGVLLGSGLAQGPGVGPEAGLALLLGGFLATAGQGLLRVVLVPRLRAEKPSRAQKAAPVAAERDAKDHIQRTMYAALVSGLVLTVGLVGLVAALSLGVVEVEESLGVPDLVLVAVLAFFGLPVVGFLAFRWLRIRRVEVELKQRVATQYKKRLSAEQVLRLSLLAGSVTLAVVFFVIGLMTQFRLVQSLGPIDLAPKFSTDFFVFAILVGLGPYGFLRARDNARTRAMDQKFPELLRDLAESKRAGMTLTQAVLTAGKGNYGALTPEVRKMAAQIEWGISFSEALERFSRRAQTPLIERSVALIVQAQNAGGNVVDILHAAAEDAREIQLLLRERKTAMSIYVMIIYISFFVFLSVIGILDAQFLPEVAKAIGGVQGVSVGAIKFGTVDVEAFEQVFFHAAIVQAMGGGFVAGVMEEGRPSAGLRHVFIMVIIGYLAFRFVMG